MTRHTLGTFESALAGLRECVFRMASLTERQLRRAEKGLFEDGPDICNEVIADDEEVDRLEKEVDRLGVDIFLRFQPVATDLREVIASIKLSNNLERVADQAVNIARKAKKLSTPKIPELQQIKPLFGLALGLFTTSVESYHSKNPEQALLVKTRDKELDRMNAAIIQDFTTRMAQQLANLNDLLNLLLVAGHLERVGDHAKNIAEETVYAVQAADIRHQH